MTEIRWTNPSVKKLTGDDTDPVVTITGKARTMILDAMDEGWQGPPFDPFLLAQQLGITVVPREDVLEARLVPRPNRIEIEYNPNRSPTRIRFSIAHEIAHTLFPDYAMSVHNRSGKPQRSDEWQLELLCNIAAAEILMPIGPSLNFDDIPLTMHTLVNIRKQYNVSMEALLLRLVKVTSQPITIFAAAKEKDDKNAPYRIDYAVNSKSSSLNIRGGMKIPPESVLSECAANGYTAMRREKWSDDLPDLDIECVGVAPYPDSIYPRVLGLIRTRTKSAMEPLAIRYLMGDATQPRGTGNKIIAYIVNDESKKWGRGFGLAISKKWSAVRTDFVKWANANQKNLKLGNSHLFTVSDELSICSMIAQHGYGASPQPRIRYRALAKCLEYLSVTAKERSATVHMPRIGTGYAGGNWDMIKEMIDEILLRQGVQVTVYDLPGREKPKIKESILDFTIDNIAMR